MKSDLHSSLKSVRAAAAVALVALVCPTVAGAAAASAAKPASGAAAQPDAKAGPNAATVNGVAIPSSWLEREIQRIVASRSKAGGEPLSAEAATAMRKDILERFIATEIVWQQVQAEKTLPSDADVEAEIANLRKRLKDPNGLDAALKAEGKTEAGFKIDVRRDLAVRRWIEHKVEAEVKPVTDAEVKAYYDGHPDEFKQQESLHLRHILIKSELKEMPDVRLAARKKAQAALARVKKGEDFAAVAKEVSEDAASAPKGGDVGEVTRGQAPPAFEEMVFVIPKGGVSDVIETDYGYHVVQVIDKVAAGTKPFAEVEVALKQFLEMRSRRAAMDQLVGNLRTKAKVVVF